MNIFESTFEKHKKLMLEAIVGGYEFDEPPGPVPIASPINAVRAENAQVHRMALEKIKALLSSGLKVVPIPVKTKKGRLYPVVVNGRRKIVLIDMGTIKLPFYCSSGEGGKENVAAGKWYPIFGIGPAGWFNKLGQDDINNYYGSDKAKSVSQKLDSVLGDLNDVTALDAIPGVVDSDSSAFAVINQDLNPVQDTKTPEEKAQFSRNIRNVLQKINGKLLPTSSKEKSSNEKTPIKGPITLTHNGEKILTANISTEVNNRLIKYEDSKFFDRDYQFKLEKQEDETWKLVHNPNAKNITNVDEKEVTEPVTLSKGMKITLGKTRRFPIEVS